MLWLQGLCFCGKSAVKSVRGMQNRELNSLDLIFDTKDCGRIMGGVGA